MNRGNTTRLLGAAALASLLLALFPLASSAEEDAVVFEDPRKPRDKVTYVPGRVTTLGALSEEVVERALRLEHRRLRPCFEKVPDRENLSGSVTLHFVIAAAREVEERGPRGTHGLQQGRATAVTVEANDTGSEELARCFAAAIRAIPFPRPHGEGTVDVRYRLVPELVADPRPGARVWSPLLDIGPRSMLELCSPPRVAGLDLGLETRLLADFRSDSAPAFTVEGLPPGAEQFGRCIMAKAADFDFPDELRRAGQVAAPVIFGGRGVLPDAPLLGLLPRYRMLECLVRAGLRNAVPVVRLRLASPAGMGSGAPPAEVTILEAPANAGFRQCVVQEARRWQFSEVSPRVLEVTIRFRERWEPDERDVTTKFRARFPG